jgi:hypothetical protein
MPNTVLDFRLRGDAEFLEVVKVLEKKLHLKGGALARHAILKLYQLEKWQESVLSKEDFDVLIDEIAQTSDPSFSSDLSQTYNYVDQIRSQHQNSK